MITAKTITGVVVVAILIGVLYVVFEKNFTGTKTFNNSDASSAQELPKDSPVQSSAIELPTPEPTLPPIDGSSNLLNEASNLQMRDYSGLFEELKDSVSK